MTYLCNELLIQIFEKTDDKTLCNISLISHHVRNLILCSLNKRKRIKVAKEKVSSIFWLLGYYGDCELCRLRGDQFGIVKINDVEIAGYIYKPTRFCKVGYELYIDLETDKPRVVTLSLEDMRNFLVTIFSTYNDVLIY